MSHCAILSHIWLLHVAKGCSQYDAGTSVWSIILWTIPVSASIASARWRWTRQNFCLSVTGAVSLQSDCSKFWRDWWVRFLRERGRDEVRTDLPFLIGFKHYVRWWMLNCEWVLQFLLTTGSLHQCHIVNPALMTELASVACKGSEIRGRVLLSVGTEDISF